MANVEALGYRSATDIVAVRPDGIARVREFRCDVAQLAALLPERSYLVNLCTDRYEFAVALAAAITRGQTCLLPPAQTPQLLLSLAERYAGLYALCDSVGEVALPCVTRPPREEAAHAPEAALVFPYEHLAAIAFTSGSTGEPTPHAKTWGHLMAGALAEGERFGLQGPEPITVVGTVPPQHMYGFESTVLMALRNGLTLFSGRPFYPADIRRVLAEQSRRCVLITTPVHLRALLVEERTLPNLSLIVCATAPLPHEMAVEAEARYGVSVHEVYGFTEAGMVATRRTAAGPQWHALPGVQLRQAADGVWVCGGHVPQPVRATDVLELTDQHTFILHGRSADLINVAGKRTSLAYLTQQAGSIPGVRDAVFYMPDERSENVTRVSAFVVAPGLTREQVLGALRERVDAAFLPRPLYLVDALPRNATGKITRDALVQFAQQHANKPGEGS